ncbi:hypothetical protein REPUB_Repub20aG0047200 [Reevesia pubescens]
MNSGLGPKVENPQGVLSDRSWFETNQFLLEVIFHHRMKQYKCLTNDSSLASAIFVPFYAGLDVGRYLWGRIAWDFRRQPGNDQSDWGSRLMSLPESMSMTMLSIESSYWSNDFALPYPTYFHPSSDSEVIRWQKRVMRSRKRRYLFSFAGAPRPSMNDSIRGEIINQCLALKKTCKFLDCKSGGNKCDTPVEVIKNYTKYCVYIPANDIKDARVKNNEALPRFSKEQVLAMRKEVVKLIPKVIYADPRSRLERFEDAFDIAVKRVLQRVEKVRKDIKVGKDPSVDFAIENLWKLK